MPRAPRQLHLAGPPYMHGADIKRAQRLLAKHGFHPGEVDGEYGPGTAEATRLAKFTLGYPARSVDQVFGELLLGILTGDVRPPAAWAKTAKARKTHAGKHASVRQAIVADARWMISNEPRIHYRQSRPIDGLTQRRKLPLYTDCSGSITDLYKWNGAPDPNGNSFNGEGYTGTMLAHCRHVLRSQVRPADLVVFGGGTGHHVCLVLETGADPLLFSHGQEKGPFEIRFSEEARYQPDVVSWLTAFPA